MSYLVLALFWSFYFFLHSALATSKAKTLIPLHGKAYRLFYSTASVLGLLPILFLLVTIPADWLWQSNGFNRFFGLSLATYGIIIGKQGFKHYPLKGFLGFAEEHSSTFKREGILNYVRHPLYLATLLLAVGYFLFSPTFASLISAVCIVAYLFIGIYFEEQKLLQRFGEAYAQYREEVPMIIPKKIKLFKH